MKKGPLKRKKRHIKMYKNQTGKTQNFSIKKGEKAGQNPVKSRVKNFKFFD